jgi:hypothetical protein
MHTHADMPQNKSEKKMKKLVDTSAGVCNNAAMIKNGTANTEGLVMSVDYWFWFWGEIVYDRCKSPDQWDAVVEFEVLKTASGR